MSSRHLSASTLMGCILVLALGGLASGAHAASAGRPAAQIGEGARNNVIEIKDRGRGPPPIAPSYLAYDWPYYFRRGHYPTHIGPGYVYYSYPYTYRGNKNPRYAGRCAYWPAKSLRRAWVDARKCVGN